MTARAFLLMAMICGLVGAAAYFFTVRVDVPRLDSFSPLLFGGVIALTVLITLSNVASARVLLAGIPWSRSLRNLYLVITTSQAANYVTTVVVGMPVRVYLYKRVLRVSTANGTAMTATEAVFGTATPALVGVLGVAVFWSDVNALWVGIGLVILGAASGAFLAMRTERATALIEGLPRSWWSQRGIAFLQRVQESVRSLDGRALASVNAVYVVAFVLSGLRLYLLLEMVGSQENVIFLIGAQGLAFTAGTLSFLPMGIGARDATLLALLLGLGIERDAAIAVTLMERLLTTGWPFALGLISAQILGFKVLFAKEADLEAPEGTEGSAEVTLPGESKS